MSALRHPFTATIALLGALLAAFVLAAPAASAGEPDLVVITGGAHVRAGEVFHDVVAIDGPVVIEGRVTGDVVAIAGSLRVRGIVDGDAMAIAGHTTVAAGAMVRGHLRYGDHRPAVARDALVGKGVEHAGWRTVGGVPWNFVGAAAMWLAVTLSTLALGLVGVWLAPGVADRMADTFRRRTGAVALTGILFFIGLPIAAVIAVITLLALPLGVAALMSLVPLGAVGYVAGAHAIGRLIAPRASIAHAFLAGWGVMRTAALLPGTGVPIAIVVVAIGLGALLVLGYDTRRGTRPAAPAFMPPAAPA